MEGYKQKRIEIAIMNNPENPQESDYIYQIICKVAKREGTDPRGLDPLEESIDTAALSTLANSATETDLTIGFSYHGYYVTVTGNGDISVENRSHHILMN